MHQEAKRLLGQGLIDLALILAILRQSDVDILPRRFLNDGALQREAFYDEGPMIGMISAPAHHFQYQTPWGEPGMSHKYIGSQYGSITDEYERIMRNTRSQSPAVFTTPRMAENSEIERIHQSTTNRSVITMVLSMPNEGSPWQQNGGGVQVARNVNSQSEGAVGGIGFGVPFSTDEHFDIFNNYIPENMRDDDIDNLMLSGNEDSSNMSANRSFLDVNWQHFIADYDADAFDNRAPLKSMNGSFGNWGNSDILSEAVQNAELFLPVATNTQNSTEMNLLVFTSSSEPGLNLCPESNDLADLLTSSRLEMIEYSEWASQNREDVLFPLLPPPSYNEVMAPGQVNLTTQNVASNVQQQSINHMHDHNYHNSSLTPPSDSVTSQSTGYSIRSRREVSTRIITVPPRLRLVSAESDSGVSSGASDTIDLTSDLNPDVVRSSVRHITTSSGGSIEEIREVESVNGYSLNSFEIKPVDSRYFDSLTKDLGLRREVILCN